MSTYAGVELLDQTSHNARESIAQAFERKGAMMGSAVGRVTWDDNAGQPFPSRSFEWFAHTRAEVGALRAFLEARKGRVLPFWTPTYCHELPLAAGALAGQSAIRVYSTGYRQYLFPVVARKRLALIRAGGAFTPVKVTLAIDNGDGTDTLSLDTTLAADLPATSLVSFLTLCRLDGDQQPIRWYAPGHAEATLRFVELPLEVPA